MRSWVKDHAIILLFLSALWLGAIAMGDEPYADARDLPEDQVMQNLQDLNELISRALENWESKPMRSRLEYSKAVQMHTRQLTALISAALGHR